MDDDEDDEEIFECTEVLQNLYLNNHANVIDSLAELIPEKTFAYVVSTFFLQSVANTVALLSNTVAMYFRLPFTHLCFSFRFM